MQDMHALITQLLQKAADAGHADCQVYAYQSQSSQLTAFEGQLDRYDVSSRQGIRLSIYKDGHVGMADTQLLDDSQFDWLIEKASQQAGYLQETQMDFYAGSSQYPNVQRDFTQLDAYPPQSMVADVLALEQACKAADSRVVNVQHCQLAAQRRREWLYNTKGLSLQDQTGLCYAYAQPILAHGDQRRDGFAWRAGVCPQALDFEAIAREATADAASYFGAGRAPSGTYPVVFSAEAMGDLLAAFSGVFNAENAQKGLSLLADKQGQAIAAAHVDLIDDPLLPESLNVAAFDGEGVATAATPVIQQGRFVTLLHNRKTAAKAGVSSTGHATIGGGIAPSNLYFAPGVLTCQQLLGQANCGLFVRELSGLHAGCNAVSGDFSLQAKGFWVENGLPARPVVQVTVGGNFFTLLQQIAAVGCDLKFGLPGGSCYGSPSILVQQLSIGGE